ncbi:MAG: hypothetical protein M3M96_09665 [Candidatus Eremiobacteraeota bacterium]|nr:hypothetical protein [Candidatus Eremiobacteraeota bacterium]
MNRAAAIAAALVFFIVALFGAHNALKNNAFMGDFRAFYCAGDLARRGHFDYSLERIAPCESSSAPRGFLSATPLLVVPAPLPGYVVAAFVPLSLLAYPLASACWWGLLFGIAVVAAVLLARLGWSTADAAIVALALPVGVVCMPPGELPPFALAGIVVAATGVQRDLRWLRFAGFAIAATQPQLALALALAMLVVSPKTWREIAAVTVGLALVSIGTIGFAENISYVWDFLPSHVAVEVHRVQQFTVSWAVAQLGASVTAATWTGRIVYVIALTSAAFAAKRLAIVGEGGAACAVAVVFALLGGPFVHQDHVVCAIPAALWLASKRGGVPGITACVLLALPVASIFANPILVLTVAAFTFWLASSYGVSLRRSAYAALGAMIFAVGLAELSVRMGLPFHAPANAAGDVWARYVATNDIAGGALIWIVKAPVWIALTMVVVAALRLTTQRQLAGSRRLR